MLVLHLTRSRFYLVVAFARLEEGLESLRNRGFMGRMEREDESHGGLVPLGNTVC